MTAPDHVKESPEPKKSTPLVLPVHRRYAVCGRSSVQRLLAQPPSEQTATPPPPSSFRNLRRKAGLPSHRSFGGILSHPLPWSTHPSQHRSNPQRKNTIVIPESPPPGGLAFPSEFRPAAADDYSVFPLIMSECRVSPASFFSNLCGRGFAVGEPRWWSWRLCWWWWGY